MPSVPPLSTRLIHLLARYLFDCEQLSHIKCDKIFLAKQREHHVSLLIALIHSLFIQERADNRKDFWRKENSYERWTSLLFLWKKVIKEYLFLPSTTYMGKFIKIIILQPAVDKENDKFQVKIDTFIFF